MWYKQISLPVRLTLIRLIGSPFILPFLFVYLLPYNLLWLNVCLAAFFFLFSLTDFFDGYLARRYQQTTVLGGMLDHIADKFLLYSVLVALVAAHKLYFFWAILWIGREFLIMALRQIALENNFSVAVSWYGKLKTVAQVICLIVIIANPYQALSLNASWWNAVEFLFLVLATALSLLSAYHYVSIFLVQFRALEKNNHIF